MVHPPPRRAFRRPRAPLRLLVLIALPLGACRTADLAGSLWEPCITGTTASLRGLCVVDRDVVWATGSGGTVLRSVDGGRTVTVHRLPEDPDNELRDVHAFDGDIAFVMACQPARVYRTLDGGATFDKVLDCGDPRGFFDGLSFVDRAQGVVFGDPIDGRFLIYTTADGGVTWQRLPADRSPAAEPGEGGFAASGTCLVVDRLGQAWIGTGIGAARVLRSRDAGASWTAAPTPVAYGPSAGIFSIAMREGRIGVAVGGDYRPGSHSRRHAITTADGGRTWQLVPGTPPRGFRSCVAYVPGHPRTLVAVGPSGTDYSTDDGHHWQPLGPNRSTAGQGFHVIDFAVDGTGFAAGSGGRLARLRR